MNEHGERLREAFETHEHLAPDPAVVYARVRELARTYQRRRRGAQVAGGAVLGAGLIAGAIQVPGWLPGSPRDTTLPMVAPAAPAPTTTPPSQAELEQRRAAYADAGYGYDEAVELARLWQSKADIGTIKAEAGRRLMAGETLPINPIPDESEPPATDAKKAAAVKKFFDTGYVYEDAVKLADLWELRDPYVAKVEAGQRLKEGDPLPIQPKPANVRAATESLGVEAFFEAGYDYDDAVKLADLWRLPDAFQAKVEGGKRLLAGETLPIRP